MVIITVSRLFVSFLLLLLFSLFFKVRPPIPVPLHPIPVLRSGTKDCLIESKYTQAHRTPLAWLLLVATLFTQLFAAAAAVHNLARLCQIIDPLL